MFDGLLYGLLILILGWAMAAIFFFFGIKDMSLSLARKLALLLALATPFMAYHVSAEHYLYRVTTLHEEVLEGSIDEMPGFPAPLRLAVFNVENPGVEHSCFITPMKTREIVFPAHIMGMITGPDHTVLLEFDETFEVVKEQHGSRIKHTTLEWHKKVFNFTPTHKGEHYIQLIPVTVGIPQLSFRISDPTKTGGLSFDGILNKKIF